MRVQKENQHPGSQPPPRTAHRFLSSLSISLPASLSVFRATPATGCRYPTLGWKGMLPSPCPGLRKDTVSRGLVLGSYLPLGARPKPSHTHRCTDPDRLPARLLRPPAPTITLYYKPSFHSKGCQGWLCQMFCQYSLHYFLWYPFPASLTLLKREFWPANHRPPLAWPLIASPVPATWPQLEGELPEPQRCIFLP